MRIVWLGLGVLMTTGVVGVIIFLSLGKERSMEMLNPITRWEVPKVVKRTEVVGFLPTWMVGKTKLYGKELTQLVFLGIEVNTDGSLVWDVQSRKINNDEYLKLKNNVAKNGGKNILGIKLFEDKKLDKLVADEEARQKLLREVRAIVVAGDFDGVNIDFEYMSNPTRIMDDDFLELIKETKLVGWGEISVDVFANTVIKGPAERIKMLEGVVDKIIVMAYDFHRPGSDYAGPVAPMTAGPGERSLVEITDKMENSGLNRQKYILAYPLYGYLWETVNEEMESATMANGYGVTVLYKDGIGYTGGKFDETAQSPWFAWTETEQRSRTVTKKVGRYYKKVKEYYEIDQWHQAYLENETSLRAKIDLAKRSEVGGIGYWALGYEGKESNLIETLNH